MIAGCKNILAKNYNPTATADNYSCVYLIKDTLGVCNWFEDYVPEADNDKSFTLSFSVRDNGWVFYHDYIPDMYFHTRNKLYTAKDNFIYEHNSGENGDYYSGKKPFYIDVVFRSESRMIAEVVHWISEVISAAGAFMGDKTITHLSMWNSHQHSGRIPMTELEFYSVDSQTRNTHGEWSFSTLRDVLLAKDTVFLQSLFKDFLVVPSLADNNKAWYDKQIMADNWFIVRFEFDNLTGDTLFLHEAFLEATKTER